MCCLWNITVPYGLITIDFEYFELESDRRCSSDSLTVSLNYFAFLAFKSFRKIYFLTMVDEGENRAVCVLQVVHETMSCGLPAVSS